MFKVGDHVVYGTNGVCLVSDITSSPFDKKDTRTYYVLRPLSGASTSLIYTPVDNDRVLMRPLLARGEAEALLDTVPAIPCLDVPEERARKLTYRNAIAAAEPKTYISLIKTVEGRRTDFCGTQRRLPDFEIEYDAVARRHLYTELSLVLGRTAEEISDCIAAQFARAQ